MTLAHHCALCEHRLFDLMKGTRCGLTKEPPAFDQKCPDIKFFSGYESNIKAVNVDLKSIQITLPNALWTLVFYFAGFVGTIIAAIVVWQSSWEHGFISNIPVIIFVAGFGLLTMAFRPLILYKRKIAVALKKKQDLDFVLAQYNIRYNIEVNITKDRHGNEEATAKLDLLPRDELSWKSDRSRP